jgi:hypothetical protein
MVTWLEIFQRPVQPNIDFRKNPRDKPISIPPPQTLREAQLSPWWPEYKDAMHVEYDGIIENNTWEIVLRSQMPSGANLVRGKWVFDDKRDEDGKILKFKARFVAMKLLLVWWS